MSNDVFINAIDEIIDVAKCSGDDSISIIWHGGEPLTVPADKYEECSKYIIEKFNALKFNVSFSMQSSLIPYKESSKFVDYVKTYMGGNIGISVDFSSRQFNGSSEKYLKTLLKRIKACRSDGITPHPNFVVARPELKKADDILKWFSENGFLRVNLGRFNSYQNHTGNKLRPTNREHSLFLISLFEKSYERYLRNEVVPRVDMIHSGILVMQGKGWGGTWKTQCQTTNYVVNPDGKTSNCPDRISDDNESFSDDSTFVNSRFKNEMIIDYFTNRECLNCSSCKYYDVCATGCPIESNNLLQEGDCSGFKVFLDYLEKVSFSRGDFLDWYLNEGGENV
ncbi:SPASM domain-containing protein [Photobacterium kishitanii]|uniref:SPASM domain-containing protein n=1 Tax=Photobacterium kishitanii TaxID=318456 RepID=A0A2T3KMZ3_9GAMM|nr:SPASM domain-containing protein [Photobacterium kishitanii]PSV01173.1 hypothetical protein C9J27_03880 [Photobacterium kishitanii]